MCGEVMLLFMLDASWQYQFSEQQRLINAFENGLVSLIPKIVFTYYMIHYFLTGTSNLGIRAGNIWKALASLILSLLLYRTLVIYFIDPVIYHWAMPRTGFFNPLGLLICLMDIIFVSGIALAIKQVKLQAEAKEKEKNLVQEKLQTELKFLRNQTNPHFLFNTLNNIYALSRKKSDEAPEAVMKLSKLLRFMLYETQKSFIPIGEEIKMVNDYLELEKMRYNGRLRIGFDHDVDDEAEKVAPLLLLPFVENAFKHGVSENRFASFVRINMSVRDHVLQFNIENSKETSNGEMNDHIGLSNVKRQLELMYADYDIQVNQEESSFQVALRINLDSHAKI